MASKSRLVLIDGNAIMHRAYHALPPLTSPSGQVVNAVYGFSTMLFRIIDELKPTHLAVAFDTDEPTFRHEEYVGYQAHRPHMEEDLSHQFQLVDEVLEAISTPVFRLAGYEADDIIGTLSHQAQKLKNLSQVIVVTGDKDLFQLVTGKTRLYVPQKGVSDYQLFDTKKVKVTLGIAPDQVIDYKALIGDPSDNYPGVPGIGPKTATTLLSQYPHLEDIYSHLDQLPEKVAQKLKSGKDLAQMSHKLATIVKDAPIQLNLKPTRFHPPDKKKAISVFQHLGFKSLVKRLSGEVQSGSKPKNSTNQLGLI